MRRKICYTAIQIIMAAVLVCACSAEGKAPESEAAAFKQAGTQTEAAAAQSDTETEEAQTETSGTNEAPTIAPDLNRNGIAEEVRLSDIDDGQGIRLEIWENGERIDVETGYFAHTGWASIFLCTLDGEDYLLRYHPNMYQGVCSYSYNLSTLADGGETTVRRNSVAFDINFGAPIHNGFDAGAIAAFMDEINDLLAHSVPMLNTDGDLLGTFEKEGRLYDSLWWLDSAEPVFVRDESQSLEENLKAFEAAMTANQEAAVPEAVDGLPVTEPLEMAFLSGVGAWRTALILNPDGSFTGDFSDYDATTVYVCRFHGRFGKVEKLTEASWLLTLEELVLDTGHSVGETWDEPDGDAIFHYISSEPYGFDDAEGALKPGAQFILYSPDATGHIPGTELYGAAEFQSWMHRHHEFNSAEDVLGTWGLQNMAAGQGFFGDAAE